MTERINPYSLSTATGDQQVPGFLGTSPPMQALCKRIRQGARGDMRVLITSESGTGKELVARAIHQLSRRSERAFVALNSTAIPEELIESELFGHVKGAFTGADKDKIGLLAAADKGALFLDDVADMSHCMQVKLLRGLEEKKVRPLGSNKDMSVDVQIIATTNRDLERLIAENEFREDLYYRLARFKIYTPPLRS